MQTYKTVDEYIKSVDKELQPTLEKIRDTIRQSAPESVESISYGMPAYKLNKKPLVYFASYSSHIGFYATPQGHEHFQKELSRYKQGKGSVQFPLDQPIHFDLIKKITEFKAQSILIKKTK